MLKVLNIQNYALISELEIDFHSGFSIITGETGAGKSILLGALSLILGQRADTAVLKDKEKNCMIEGVFDVSEYQLQSLFDELELDYSDQTTIRRIISPAGKSRAFINDIPVNLNQLKDLGVRLIDIHSQHRNLELADNRFQLMVVDSYAQNKDLLIEYASRFKEYRKTRNEWEQLKQTAQTEKKDTDFLQFQYDELAAAKLKEGEQTELEAELEVLEHAGEIKNALGKTSHLLHGEDLSVVLSLKSAIHAMDLIAAFYPKATGFKERLVSANIELEDIAAETEVLAEDVEFDPDRAAFLKDKLNSIYSLLQKHRMDDVSGLIQLRDSLAKKLENINSYDQQIEALAKLLAQQKSILSETAKILSKKRKSVVADIENVLQSQLQQLGMPNAQFKIDMKEEPDFGASGIDQVNFMFSANKNSDLQEISKVASGGEISRFMLSVKAMISASVALPTIIFDEIDTGVSGDIADKMGSIMKQMAVNMQVVSITHLPQVAAKGDHHYFVYKSDDDDSTSTQIKHLNKEERVTEIAKMLSGANVTAAALANAKQLIGK